MTWRNDVADQLTAMTRARAHALFAAVRLPYAIAAVDLFFILPLYQVCKDDRTLFGTRFLA